MKDCPSSACAFMSDMLLVEEVRMEGTGDGVRVHGGAQGTERKSSHTSCVAGDGKLTSSYSRSR